MAVVEYESIVSPVSRCYMRVVNGSLVVCLSDILVIKVHIGHESSVGISRRHYEYIESAIAIFPSSTPVPRKVAGECLVLVFAATFSEMALQSVYLWNRKTQAENKMSKLSINKSKLRKVRMNYSRCHRY